jgi:hypothetical protein
LHAADVGLSIGFCLFFFFFFFLRFFKGCGFGAFFLFSLLGFF